MSALQITRGDDESLTILVTDPDSAPVDLTGATLTFMVKRGPTGADANALLTKATGGSGIVLADQGTDPGEATITINDTDTDGLPAGTFFWELQSVDAAAKVKTLAKGQIRILADLVRES